MQMHLFQIEHEEERIFPQLSHVTTDTIGKIGFQFSFTLCLHNEISDFFLKKNNQADQVQRDLSPSITTEPQSRSLPELSQSPCGQSLPEESATNRS